MPVITFPYLLEQDESGAIVCRPQARIHVQTADGCWQPFRLYADACADLTLLRQVDCERLGYPLEEGELRYIGGVCSGLIPIHIHTLTLRLGTEEFPCPIAFAKGADVPRLLGREGVFQRFIVCYDETDKVTHFITKPDAHRYLTLPL
ncbi:MAG TPA: hypothetical protein EYP85_07630 [Armatimonadetes bacterium]|nr:hypothetical protein [Armatimonadota bacterium]